MGTIGAHRGVEIVVNFSIEYRLTTKVSTSYNTNNHRVTNKQIALIQTLEAQMEEIQQKRIKDQWQNEEDQRRNE